MKKFEESQRCPLMRLECQESELEVSVATWEEETTWTGSSTNQTKLRNEQTMENNWLAEPQTPENGWQDNQLMTEEEQQTPDSEDQVLTPVEESGLHLNGGNVYRTQKTPIFCT
jgi:hypothetical protein